MTLPKGHVFSDPGHVHGPVNADTIILFVTFCKPYEKTMPILFVISDDPSAVNTLTVRSEHTHKILSAHIKNTFNGVIIPGGAGSFTLSSSPKQFIVETAFDDCLDKHVELHSEGGGTACMCTPSQCTFITEILSSNTEARTLWDTGSVANISCVVGDVHEGADSIITIPKGAEIRIPCGIFGAYMSCPLIVKTLVRVDGLPEMMMTFFLCTDSIAETRFAGDFITEEAETMQEKRHIPLEMAKSLSVTSV